MPQINLTTPLTERFWKQVKKTDTCWIWIGGTSRGYGHFKINRKTIKSHRFSWELHNSPIPEGLNVLHRCDNRPCIRPSHLFLGTHTDNMQDAVKKGRKQPKLTEAKVLEIRSLYKFGVLGCGCRSLAKQFNVSIAHIRCIVSRKTWKHI